MSGERVKTVSSDPLLAAGHLEGFKLAVHLGIFGLSMAAALYNLGAWLARRERHLAVNACVYVGLVGWEAWQVERHAQEVGRGDQR